MGKRFLQLVGYWALALLMLMATMIIIRWMIDFATWSTIDSGWAQAIGSVAAILVTVILFRRQNEALARQAANERKLDLLQRRQATWAICVRASEMIEEICEAFFGHINDVIRIEEYFDETFSERAFAHMSEVLSAVPHHDLGSYFLTAGVLDLRDAIDTCGRLGAEGQRFEGNSMWREEVYAAFLRIEELRQSGMESIDTAMKRARKDAARA